MSLDHALTTLLAALNANTEACNQLTVAMRGTAPTVAAPAPEPPAAPPAALPNGMPGGPFGSAAPAFAPPPPPAAPAGVPFTDLVGCTKYAVEAHGLLEAKAPGRGAVVAQLIQHLCGSGSINDLPTTAYPQFYEELEKQKAL